MLYDKLFEFSDAQSMPNGVAVIATNIMDWDSGMTDLGEENSHVPRWLFVRVNTAPSAGTSLNVKAYTHTTTTITDGKLLLTGREWTQAEMTAGKVLFCAPLAACLPPDDSQYFGLVYTATGNVSSGKVDAMLLADGHPLLKTTQVMVSNI